AAAVAGAACSVPAAGVSVWSFLQPAKAQATRTMADSRIQAGREALAENIEKLPYPCVRTSAKDASWRRICQHPTPSGGPCRGPVAGFCDAVRVLRGWPSAAGGGSYLPTQKVEKTCPSSASGRTLPTSSPSASWAARRDSAASSTLAG